MGICQNKYPLDSDFLPNQWIQITEHLKLWVDVCVCSMDLERWHGFPNQPFWISRPLAKWPSMSSLPVLQSARFTNGLEQVQPRSWMGDQRVCYTGRICQALFNVEEANPPSLEHTRARRLGNASNVFIHGLSTCSGLRCWHAGVWQCLALTVLWWHVAKHPCCQYAICVERDWYIISWERHHITISTLGIK